MTAVQVFKEETMKSIRTLLTLLMAGAIGLFHAQAFAQTIKIGVINTYSGPNASLGDIMDKGMKLYMKQNEKRLPPGVKIELGIRDDGGANPDKAKQLAQELIVRDKVQILTGLIWTPNAAAIAPLATEAKLPVVIMNAGTSSITTMSPYFARVSFTLWQSSFPTGTWAAKKYKRAYIAVSDFGPGIDAENAFEKAFRDGGGEIVGKGHNPKTKAREVPPSEFLETWCETRW